MTRRFLFSHGYFLHDLSASRFCRRLHAIDSQLWRSLFRVLGEVFMRHTPSQNDVVDSFPVPDCDNIRIKGCTLLPGENHRGYLASKRRFFFGLKVHLLVTGRGEPIELVLTPGSTSDVVAFDAALSAGALIHADRAYTDYAEEGLLQEAAHLTLQPQRKKNSNRPVPLCREFVSKPVRQRIEIAFSQITRLFPKHIYAITARGFALKIVCFLLAYSLHYLQT